MKDLFLILAVFTMHNWAHCPAYAYQELDSLRDQQDVQWREGKLNSECNTHFSCELVSLAGEWVSYVHYAAEDGTAVMLDDNCTKVTWFARDTVSEAVQIQHALTVGTDKSITIGHQFGMHEDFYGVLTVTMTQKPNRFYEKVNNAGKNCLKQSSPPPKMCVFYIGASGPAHPVVYADGFHDASCTLKSSTITRHFNMIAN